MDSGRLLPLTEIGAEIDFIHIFRTVQPIRKAFAVAGQTTSENCARASKIPVGSQSSGNERCAIPAQPLLLRPTILDIRREGVQGWRVKPSAISSSHQTLIYASSCKRELV